MKNLILAVLAMAGIVQAQISALTLPHIIDSATIPKVSYVDDNDIALKNKINVLIDSVNADSLFLALSSNSNLRLTIDADNNATGTCFSVTHNGASDTIAKFCDDLSGKAYGRFSVVDSIIGASARLSGNLAAVNGTYSGTLGVTGASALGAVTASGNIVVNSKTTIGSNGVLTLADEGIVLNRAGGGGYLGWQNGSGSDRFIWLRDNAANELRLRTDTDLDGVVDFSAITIAASGAITIPSLAGTGIRLTTSTSTGVLGNATTIAGANTWSDKQTHTTAPRFNSATASEFLLLDGSKDLTSVAGNGTGNVVRTTSPTLVTPALGAATATTIALGGNEAFTYDEGTFTAAATGMSACAQGSLSGSTCTGTASYVRVGKQVTVSVPNLYGTSNSTACSITGVPAAISPAAVVNQVSVDGIYDNGNNHVGIMSVGLVANEFRPYFRTSLTSPVNSTFTNSGTKGFIAFTITYTLQ